MPCHSVRRRSSLREFVILLTVSFVLTLSSSAWAQSTGTNAPKKQLRQPTPEEIKNLTDGMKKSLSRDATGLVVVKHPNGAESVNLQGRFMNLDVVKINPDGTLSEKCVSNVDEAKRFLQIDASSSKPDAAAKKSSHQSAVPEVK
ncbi:MAG TPA: hypothetical protein VFA67_14025 [Candidatus Sulfotelmatobacter sp.]|nr:hypothetical protein [Candidatus Sulfotelmatobacter sp.]